MTADSLDNHPYSPASDHESEATRRHYWAVAIGLQDVDGLQVSPYLRDAAQAHIKGEHTLTETGDLVRLHHASGHDPASLEADLVSQRIAELLSAAPFYLAPEMLMEVHRYLFQDLDPSIYHPGEFKAERMVKQEDILNGDSVLYADPLTYEMALRGVFATEQGADYHSMAHEDLAAFSHRMAFIWQVHPFYEGNTRTIAVFSELYLNHLGFDVTNEPFEKHARYFRDALVRAMYRNAAADIMPDSTYLTAFYENVLGFAQNPLVREDLICTRLFDEPQLIRNVDPEDALNARSS